MTFTNHLAAVLSLIVVLPLATTTVQADLPPSQLVISQFKVTSSNGQFFTLYNTTNQTLDMSKFQLEYFNSFDITKATSSRLITLSGSLPAHGYFMVSDTTQLLCFQMTVESASLGLSSTTGLVELLAFSQTIAGGPVQPILQDYVGWSKTAATGAQTLPTNQSAFFSRQPLDKQNNPDILAAGSGSWQTVQPDSANGCKLVSSVTLANVPSPPSLIQLLPGQEPPATVIGIPEEVQANLPALPASDAGLMAPMITELLPNPNGSGTDATDEFIELYNPNTAAFDLSGFTFEAGTTTLHSFTLPSGTSLSPKSFTAFYAKNTGLSLSNSGGQVALLDPLGTSVSSSSTYESAKDGQAWALANGTWYWTITLTPGEANIITQPAPAKTATKVTAAKASKPVPQVKAASTKTARAAPTKLTNVHTPSSPTTSPIHAWTLALVAALALLYGAYEYRTDLANRIYQHRRNRAARRANRL